MIPFNFLNSLIIKRKIVLVGVLLMVFYNPRGYCQELIQGSRRIEKDITTNESFELQFVNSSPLAWYLFTEFDTTILSITSNPEILTKGGKTKRGEDIHTLTFKGLKKGVVKLGFAYGYSNDQSKLYQCIVLVKVDTILSKYEPSPIESDTLIEKEIDVNESFDLCFVDWPSPGIRWKLYIPYDTTILSIKRTFVEPINSNFHLGSKQLTTYRYKGLKKGSVYLEYYYGRPWIEEKIHKCRVFIYIKEE